MDIQAIFDNKNRNEVDLHRCIIEALENQGYETYDFHDAGAAWEDGIDVLSKNKDDYLAFAVKLYPQKKDIKQLVRLAKVEFNKKIFVYMFSPTRDFHKEMLKHKNVEFWEFKKVDDFLRKNKSLIYSRYLLLNTDLMKNIFKIIECLDSSKNTKASILEINDLDNFFLLKDKTVMFRGATVALNAYYSHEIKNIYDESNSPFYEKLDNLFQYLDLLNRYIVTDLQEAYNKIKNKNPGLLSSFWERVRDRSNWCQICQALESGKNKKEDIERWMFGYREYSAYNFLVAFVKNLEDLAENLEFGIDSVWEKRKFKTKH